MEPKIGIVVCGFAGDRQFVTNPYIQSVRYSKGLPLVLPVVRSDRLIREYTGLCDGFLFCGGEDITPLLFGEEPCRGNGNTDITVDLFQIRLIKQILRSGKPVLAICRGMQILNVACGGTIWQDLSLAPGHTLDHMQKTVSRSEASHRIRTERGSLIREYFGPQFTVNEMKVNSPLKIEKEKFGGFIIYMCINGGAAIQVPVPDGKGGKMTESTELKKGETVLVPADMPDFVIVPTEKDTLLVEAMVERQEEVDNYINPNTEPYLEGEDYEGLEDEEMPGQNNIRAEGLDGSAGTGRRDGDIGGPSGRHNMNWN